ncbi:MAG: recombinase XerC [Chloroflexi bacterium]|nr:MAG: recombinase XerC [Chloroflexota bacterium]
MSGVKFDQLLAEYHRYLEAERNFSRYTVRNYTTDVLDFLQFLRQGQRSLEEVDHLLIRSWLGQLLKRGIARGSICRKLSALRSFFRYLSREGKLSTDPMSTVSGPKRERKLPSFLTLQEIQKLLEAPDTSTPQGLRDRALLELLYAAGLRVSEVVALNVGNVDLKARQIRVWGKRSKERVVLIGRPAAEALERYLKLGRPKLSKRRSEALFLNRYGKRIAARRVQRLVREYAQIAGIDRGVFPHMLRHTFATHMLDGGADLRAVQELLGHANLASTQIYTHVTQSQMRRKYLKAHPRSEESEPSG